MLRQDYALRIEAVMYKKPGPPGLFDGPGFLLAGVDGSRTHRGPLCAARHRF